MPKGHSERSAHRNRVTVSANMIAPFAGETLVELDPGLGIGEQLLS
jgi:hypothetical protein